MITFQEFQEGYITESTPAELIGRLEKSLGRKLSPGFNQIANVDVNILDTEDGDTAIQIELINDGDASAKDMSAVTKYLKGAKFKVKKLDKETVEIS